MKYLGELQLKLSHKKPALTSPEVTKLRKNGFSDSELFLDNIKDIDNMVSLEGRKGLKVSKLNMRGRLIKKYQSITIASQKTGVAASAISAICKGNTCRKTAGGYKWKYA